MKVQFTQKKWCGTVVKILRFLLCVALLLYAAEITGSGSPGWRFSYVFMYVFLLAVCALLYALTGSLPWTVRIMTIVTAIYCVTNYFVLQFRGTPFVPQDVLSVKTALGVRQGYIFSFSLPLAELVLITSGILFVSPKLAIPVQARRIRAGFRVAALILSIAFFATTFNVRYFGDNGYAPSFWNQNESVETNGSALNFVANIVFSVQQKPATYSLDIVAGIADGYHSDPADSARIKPDIILIVGESWSNAAPEETVHTNIPATPFFDSFKTMENGIYRDLLVTTYGGGTSRSEFQVLTGANLIHGFHADPFKFNVSAPMPNLVSTLKQLGYDTTALHTGEKDAWSRDQAFGLLGFDRFYDKADIEKTDDTKVRYYLSDKSLYAKTLSILAESDAPQLIYAVTIQTHGGYTYYWYDSPVQIESPAGSYPEVEQYLGLMNQSDADFAAFITELEQRDRPTIVLAYGDHRPQLDKSYMDAIAVGKKDVWLNQTFYLMWANYPLPEAARQAPTVVGLNYLGVKLLQAAELPLTGYQKFLLEGAEHYPAISYDYYYDKDGNCLTNDQMPDWIYYNDQAVMQYNLIYDVENRADYFFNLAE